MARFLRSGLLAIALTPLVSTRGFAAETSLAETRQPSTLPTENARWKAVVAAITDPLAAEDRPQGEWTDAAAVAGEVDSLGHSLMHYAVQFDRPNLAAALIAAGCPFDAANAYGVRPLHVAAEYGSAQCVQTLLAAGAEVSAVGPGGATPLVLAVRSGRDNAVTTLLDAGADVDRPLDNGQTPLMFAAAGGSASIAKSLLAAGCKHDVALKSSGLMAIHYAARHGHWPVVEVLIAAGADINLPVKPSRTPERAPRPGMTPLMFAVESGHFETALRIVDAGGDPNDLHSGYAPLHALTWVRRSQLGDNPAGDPEPRGSGAISSLDFVADLVRRGAKVDIEIPDGKSKPAQFGERGVTPLILAAFQGDVALFDALIAAGANPHHRAADGTDSLIAAAGLGVNAVGEFPGTAAEVCELIDRLVATGLSVDHANDDGQTAMHGAAYRSEPEVVTHLAKLGADPAIWNRPNRFGWTPFDIAAGKRPGSFKPSPEVIAALKEAL